LNLGDIDQARKEINSGGP